MQVIGLKTPLIKPGDDLVNTILNAAKKKGGLRKGDVLVIASSAYSTSQGLLTKLSDVKPTAKAKKLSRESGLSERLSQVIIQEADNVLGVGERSILTLKDGILCPNAGVDVSNAPKGHVLLMPRDGNMVALEIFKKIERVARKKVGIVLSDSHVQPLRLGTIGQAIGVAGIPAAIDCRSRRDLYGRTLRITFRAIADQLASAAQVVMGEADEQIPAVIIRGAKIPMKGPRTVEIKPERDLYTGVLLLKK